jgi:hypothetical protein
MNGISKSKHEHLIEALLQLENLLLEKGQVLSSDTDDLCDYEDPADIINACKAAGKARVELEEIYTSYNLTLESLSALIKKYDELYNFIRAEYISKRLKELKRSIQPDNIQFQSLRDNIRTVYRT